MTLPGQNTWKFRRSEICSSVVGSERQKANIMFWGFTRWDNFRGSRKVCLNKREGGHSVLESTAL